MTTAVILNIAFSIPILAAIVGSVVWAIVTNHRDHGVTLVSGQRRRHWAWSGQRPRVRPHPGLAWAAI